MHFTVDIANVISVQSTDGMYHEYDLCFIYTDIIILNYNILTRIFITPNKGNYLFLNK